MDNGKQKVSGVNITKDKRTLIVRKIDDEYVGYFSDNHNQIINFGDTDISKFPVNQLFDVTKKRIEGKYGS